MVLFCHIDEQIFTEAFRLAKEKYCFWTKEYRNVMVIFCFVGLWLEHSSADSHSWLFDSVQQKYSEIYEDY